MQVMSDTLASEAALENVELMRAIAEDRDRQAFARIFAIYAPKLKAFLINGGLDAAVAEEVVQDVMLTVWRRADRYDPALGGVSTWIFTIARNRRIDFLRRAQRNVTGVEIPEPEFDESNATDALVEREQSYNSVREALTTLPAEQAQVLKMAFFQQKSHSVIAAEQSLPLGTVKSRIRLALRQLRRNLETEHERPSSRA